VLVRHAGGAFLLKRPGSSWWRERRLEKRLTAWWRGEMWRGEIALPETAGVEALPRPDLPVLAFTSPPRWKMVWAVAKQTAVLFFGTLLALSVLMRLSGDNAIYSVLVFVVPLTYILAVLPMLFRRRRA
jgi:hypothetical protein